MVTVQKLYELWAGDSRLDAALEESLEPRGTEWLFELFSSLGPRAGETFVDVGARDARHAIRLVREHGLRGLAVDPLPLHVESARAQIASAGVADDLSVAEAAIERLPLDDQSVDWIWCRDVLVHADTRRGFAECARVLRGGGSMVAYVTLATDLLEPRERGALAEAMALVPESLDPALLERNAADAGLVTAAVHRLEGEWRERMIEDGTWDAGDALLRLSRLRRREEAFADAFGRAAVDAYRGGQLWGIYQLLGKLCPTVYVWEKRV
jgi:SAM-dependent methyltransferase